MKEVFGFKKVKSQCGYFDIDDNYAAWFPQYWNKDWCVSFKRQCLQKFPMNYFKMPKDPQQAKIIVFHGRPTPMQAYKGFFGKMGLRYVKPTKWLEKYW